jgi:hypothetical protein
MSGIRCLGASGALMALVVAGCAGGSAPQTPDEFRKTVPTAFMGQVTTFEVARPVSEVGRTFQARAPECLDVAVRGVDTKLLYAVTTTYKPSVSVGDKKAELRVQRKFSGAVFIPYKEPEGGTYFLVVEATAIDKGRSRIDVYGFKVGMNELMRAVTGWATGQDLGCPDMTKT